MVATMSFDVSQLDRELRRLLPRALHRLLNALTHDLDGLPFDLFVSQNVPAADADAADEIRIGFRLLGQGEPNA